MAEWTAVGPMSRGTMFRVHASWCRDVNRDERASGNQSYPIHGGTVEQAVAADAADYAEQGQDMSEAYEILPCCKK